MNIESVPDKDIGITAARRNQGIRLVPARTNEMALCSEEPLDLALNVPHSRNVVVGTS